MGKQTLLIPLTLLAVAAVVLLVVRKDGMKHDALFVQEISPSLLSRTAATIASPEQAWLINDNKLHVLDLFGGFEQHAIGGGKLWSYTADNSPLNMFVSVAPDGTSFIGGMSDELICVGPDGKEKWRKSLKGSKQRNTCPVASTDGRVYAAAPDGFLYALDESGNILWELEDAAISGKSGLYVTPDESKVIVPGSAGSLLAYDSSGNALWQNHAGIASLLRGIFNCKGELVLPDPSGHVSVLDCNTGLVTGSFSLGGAIEDKLAVLSDDSICCVRETPGGLKSELVCFDASGKQCFARPIGGMFNRILADKRGGLFVLEPGEERAKPLSYIPGMQYSNARLVRLDNHGKELASVKLPFMFAFTNMLQRADGSVLVYGIDGNLYCFDL